MKLFYFSDSCWRFMGIYSRCKFKRKVKIVVLEYNMWFWFYICMLVFNCEIGWMLNVNYGFYLNGDFYDFF